MKFEWQPNEGPLRGKCVFLSASVPIDGRAPRYLKGPLEGEDMRREIDRRVNDSVKSLVSQVLGAGGQLIHGGHPAVIEFIADQAGHWFVEDPKEKRRPVVTYQSEHFKDAKPLPGRVIMERLGVAETRWAPTGLGALPAKWELKSFFEIEEADPLRPSSQWRQTLEKRLEGQAPAPALREPLLAMRLQMLMETKPVATICIGGMEGVEAEAKLFRDLVADGRIPMAHPVQVLGSTFGAAGDLVEEPGIQIFDKEETKLTKAANAKLGDGPDYDDIIRRLIEKVAQPPPDGLGHVGR